MSISITDIRSATSAEWDLIWQQCDYATYFHSREWAEIWNGYTNGNMRPCPKLITFSDGKKVLLPLSVQKLYKGLIKKFISSPAGTYGGWLSLDELSGNHVELLIDYLKDNLGNLVWRINPYEKSNFESRLKNSFNDETLALNLKDGFDAIYKGWTKGHRSAVTKARRESVSVRRAVSTADWQAYYGLYEDSLKRWGDTASSRYGWGIFEEMMRRNSPNITLLLALHGGVVIAGALCFSAKKHMVYWHGAALESYFQLRPVNLIVCEAIKDSCEKGYSWFDFNPSGGHEGVKAFKKSFGSEELKCPVVIAETITNRFLRRIVSIRHG